MDIEFIFEGAILVKSFIIIFMSKRLLDWETDYNMQIMKYKFI